MLPVYCKQSTGHCRRSERARIVRLCFQLFPGNRVPPKIEAPIETSPNEGWGLVLEGVGIDDVNDRSRGQGPICFYSIEQRFDPLNVGLDVRVQKYEHVARCVSGTEYSGSERRNKFKSKSGLRRDYSMDRNTVGIRIPDIWITEPFKLQTFTNLLFKPWPEYRTMGI